MKKTLSRIFNVFMAILVLISSTGFGLIEHSCTVRGKQTSLHKSSTVCCVNPKHQQSNNQKASLKKAKCCSEQEKYENVEYSSSASQVVAKFAQNALDWVKTTVITFAKTIVETILENISSSNKSSSTSPTGREILVFIQSFLI
jgi:hypothetical protein